MATLDELAEMDERKRLELNIAEKKALIAEAKKRYGSDWKKFVPGMGKGGGGMDWEALRFQL